MSNILNFPTPVERRVVDLEGAITAAIAHPDPEVLVRWRELSRPYIRKYVKPPARTQPELSLPMPVALSPAEEQAILDAVTTYMLAYHHDVETHVMTMLADIVFLQGRLAERDT